jgi:hypothetical protein
MQVKMTILVIAESEVTKHKGRFTFHLNGMTSDGQNVVKKFRLDGFLEMI